MASKKYDWRAAAASMALFSGLVAAHAMAANAPAGNDSAPPSHADPTTALPAAKAEEVGLSARDLELLKDQLKQLVDQQQIVGGELMVIKGGRTVLDAAYGWKDRESKLPMQTGALYCVRSMTKPLVGTAVQMLIDEGKLSPDTRVGTILPAFDRPAMQGVTIEQLLTHSAGFPLTTLRRPLSDYPDLNAIASEAATAELLFKPGDGFQYSDAGADILGAVVAKVSGMPLEAFLQQRLLNPLRMTGTYTLLGGHRDVQGRVPSAYSGGTGAWTKHWDPGDPPIFPVFLGSQGLYSTTKDYAKFLALWMNDGRADGRRLLSHEAIVRGLEPSHAFPHDPYPIDGPGGQGGYGQLWMVRTRIHASGARTLSMFGHDGSDGTHAWVWPEQQLIVLFFTQSRGTLSGLAMASKVQQLLVDQDRTEAKQEKSVEPAKPHDAAQIPGLYWDADVASAYYVITEHAGRVELDRPGGMHVVFRPEPNTNRFVAEANAKVWISFDRDADGKVIAMRTFFGKREEVDRRHVADPGLPSLQTLIERSQQTHQIERLKTIGVVRLTGTIHYVDRKIEGRLDNTFDFDHNRVQVKFGAARQVTMTDGDRAWSQSSDTGLDELSGRLREQTRNDRLPVLLGDWRQYYKQVSVLKRIQFGEQSLIMLRVTPREGSVGTLYIDEGSGRLIRSDALVMVPGIGIVGVQTMFDDYRDVAGMQIPFKTKSKFQHPMIGIVEVAYEEAEVGVKTRPTTFRPRAALPGGE